MSVCLLSRNQPPAVVSYTDQGGLGPSDRLKIPPWTQCEQTEQGSQHTLIPDIAAPSNQSQATTTTQKLLHGKHLSPQNGNEKHSCSFLK